MSPYPSPGQQGRYAVLGGGAAGLALARRLAHAGQHVTLFEREPQPGGLAAGFRVGDAWLEHFYHHIFRSDRVVIRTIEELGLRSRLLWGNPPARLGSVPPSFHPFIADRPAADGGGGCVPQAGTKRHAPRR